MNHLQINGVHNIKKNLKISRTNVLLPLPKYTEEVRSNLDYHGI